MEEDRSAPDKRNKPGRRFIPFVVTLAAIVLAIAMPVLSWFVSNKQLLSYAPVSSPEALYIGAGHRDAEAGTFEDIRYLYFNGVNANEAYSDHVFCVYGTAISGFYLQLAFTTNNQFEYEIYVAEESTTPSPGAVKYAVHDGSNDVYYYSVDGDVNGGEPVEGGFLNKTEADGYVLADASRHASAYDDYSHVNRFAEALYWQTDDPIQGHATDDFVVYFILRVKTNGKASNDRETDVLCISAKSVTVVN
jgi:hypothetical protein